MAENQTNTSNYLSKEAWCQICAGGSICASCEDERIQERQRIRNSYQNWSTGDRELDRYLEERQIEHVNDPFSLNLRWVDYDQFVDIQFLKRGGEGTIYTASCPDGLWEHGPVKVALKTLDHVTSIDKFIRELDRHVNFFWTNIPICYGVTKNPKTDQFMMVFEFADMGDLRHYLRKIQGRIGWKDKIQIGLDISEALQAIHETGYVHGDLHSGNILRSRSGGFYVSDLGLSSESDRKGDAEATDNGTEVSGLLPYIAPEILRQKGTYSTAADVFSFGMLMWEVSAGKPPFSGRQQDYDLVQDIIGGMRPDHPPNTPDEYRKLMERCWQNDPRIRPQAYEIYKKFFDWKQQKSYEKWDQPEDKHLHKFPQQTEMAISPGHSLVNEDRDVDEVYVTRQYLLEIPEALEKAASSQQ